MEWVSLLKKSEYKNKRAALLAVKCVHEVQDSKITMDAAQKLDGGSDSGFDLSRSNIEPMDCRGLFELLIHVKNLTCLYLASNRISDQGVRELCKLLGNVPLDKLDIANNSITNDGIGELCDVIIKKRPSLRYLNVTGNIFTNDGLKVLCEVLKHDNCALNSLVIGIFGDRVPCEKGLSLKSREYICNALKHENCKLESLFVLWFSFESLDKIEEEFKDIHDLCDALRHKNCKLKRLNLGYYGSHKDRREQLERASHVPGFQTLRSNCR